MGVAITELLTFHEHTMEDYRGKTLAIDTSMWLHQFLSSIRSQDGTPLMDSHGATTSHLVGLFSRVPKLLALDINPIFVFDGTPPELKKQERERRRKIKEEATALYHVAAEKQDTELMRKYASRTTHITNEIVAETRELLDHLGVAHVQAPSEAEAQCAHMVKQGQAYAVATNDADALLFGASRIVRNLSIAGKRKRTNKLAFETINPEEILLHETLASLGITHEQLIALSMLIGTDYNYGGIKGIGPKNALKLVRKHGNDFHSLFAEAHWADTFNTPYEEIMRAFQTMPVTDCTIERRKAPNEAKLIELLVERHSFSEERVTKTIELLQASTKKQSSLFDFT